MLQILYFLQPGKFKTYQMAFVGNIYHLHNICPNLLGIPLLNYLFHNNKNFHPSYTILKPVKIPFKVNTIVMYETILYSCLHVATK